MLMKVVIYCACWHAVSSSLSPVVCPFYLIAWNFLVWPMRRLVKRLRFLASVYFSRYTFCDLFCCCRCRVPRNFFLFPRSLWLRWLFGGVEASRAYPFGGYFSFRTQSPP